MTRQTVRQPDIGPADPCELVRVAGHDCPDQLLCFQIDCRCCGQMLREHAPVDTIRQLVKAAVDAHACSGSRRSGAGRRGPEPQVAAAS